jgi:hypothetical protein
MVFVLCWEMEVFPVKNQYVGIGKKTWGVGEVIILLLFQKSFDCILDLSCYPELKDEVNVFCMAWPRLLSRT